jgi:hypothetical protein
MIAARMIAARMIAARMIATRMIAAHVTGRPFCRRLVALDRLLIAA